ncbi:hypothetical protein B296_00022044 [Ensete ventricosum]|uniref:Uncharacterized protein n=1 Tax=Ensete ventricosum TaxID=4639 RepID=A0A427AUD7_ENSVE|nr:hypothetical protein B296_00022044 [Ensete ventricosum]
MKDPRNNMIPLLPLQEFMSLTSVQGKLCASAQCFIFYIDSLYGLGYFTKFHSSCSTPRLHGVDSGPHAHHSTGQPSVESDFHIGSKCAFI